MNSNNGLQKVSMIVFGFLILFILNPISVSANGVSDAIQKVVNVYPNSCSYFTSDGKKDSNSSDSRCSLTNIPSRGGLPLGKTVKDARGREAWSCHGFAEYVWYVVFGHCTNTQAQNISASELKIGDFIRFKGHSAIYLGENANYYYVYDSNWASPADNKVRYNHTINKSREIEYCYRATNYDSIANVDPSYKDFSISKNEYKLKEKIEFFITPINTTGIGISIDKEGVGRVVGAGCNRANGHDIWASDLGVGNYSAHITVYNGNKWVDTETVWFSIVDPQPSYSNFSVSQSVYNLHDKIQFKIDPINATGIGISIDKEGVGRVVAEDCNEASGHLLWGINLGVGNYSAHITVYNDEKWIDTNTVYFSVVPPGYSNFEINKQKVGTAEDMKFKINTSHAEFMVLKIENERGEERYVERCGDSLDSWSVKADKLGVGNYKAYFLVFSTNDYYIETEKIPFTVYQSPERSKLTCLPGNSYSKTIFQWEESAYTDYYDLRIDAADYEKGGNIKNVWQLRGNRCSVWLPAGEYAAHVDSVNKDGAVGGELIYFTVKEGKAGTPVNLGSEVRARIITSSGRPIMNDEKKVKLDSGKKENLNQIWKFMQQSDNSYVVYSDVGNGVLTAQNSVGSSVYIDQYQNLDLQKWNLYGNSEDGYVLKSVGTGYVLGLSGEASVFGNYVLKYSDDQMFEIEKTSEIKIDTPAVSVENLDGETNGNIKVKWNTCDNATNYDLLLYDADGKELKKKISDIEGTSYILKLAVGNYYVCIQAKNKQTGGKTTSEQVKFTVKENISICNMILEKNVFEYDGTEKKPQVRVYNTQGNLLQSSEYSVAYENNLNAGTATVRITGKNAYLGTKTIDFVINKASQKLRSSMDGKRVPDGEKVNLGIIGIGKMSYQVEQKDIAEVDANGMVIAKTAGNVNILITAEGDKNYNQAQITVRFIFEHQYDDGVITTAASCEVDGERTYTCAGCKANYTEKIKATGHQHTELRNVTAATCAQEGYTGDTYCKNCNTKLASGKVIPKTEHSWDSGKITTVATCNEKGIKTYICTECNVTRTEEIPSTGHQHTELRNVTAATCAQEGYTGDIYCKDCNTKLASGKVIPKTEHSWDSGKITTAATCNGKGIKTYTCTGCNATKTEEIPSTDHQHTELRNVTAATCAQEGYTGDSYCQDCGKLLEEGQVIPKIDHVWNKGEVTTTSTCTSEGIKTYTCTSCGTTKTEAIAATGHGATEIRNKKAATTTSEGYTGDTYCTICNQKISSGNTLAKLTPQTATPGKTLKDKSTNGVYKVLKDGVSVEFMKPVYKKASARIPDTIKVNGITCKVTGISANAFKNNKSLKSVTIGRNVTVIGTNAFYGCKKLSKVNGGNGIIKIGHRAFANCVSLSRITIPGTVRSIGKQAFCNCKKLKSITIKTSTLSGKAVGSKAFTGTYKKPTVKVPAKQMKAYKKLLTSKGMSSKAVYKK